MATPRQLVEATAEILGVSLATAIVHDRNLASAAVPLRTVAGRGRAAATVTAVDAANLLIAIVATESVKDSVKTVLAYRDLRGTNAVASSVTRYDVLPAGHTFGEALAAFVDAAANKEIKLDRNFNLKIEFYGPRPKAKIEWEIGGRISWTLYEPKSKWPTRGKASNVGDLQRTTAITESTIFCVGEKIGAVL
jgi:hypothetical protein